MVKISPSEITPEHIFRARRKFMVGVGSAVGLLALAACAAPTRQPTPGSQAPADASEASQDLAAALEEVPSALAYEEPYASAPTDELGDDLNTYEQITNYNNFYEFTTDKEDVAPMSQGFTTYPWTVEVTGMVRNPKTYAIEDLISKFPQEERIYRLRCVEAWSMVIPWVGFPINLLLKEVEPTADAKYVKFTSVMRPEEMPGQSSRWLDWPYVEGLRIDEAMHDLAIIGTGMYGKLMTPQNGAPLRIVTPWKYGFKSIKSIVKIELTDVMPQSTWMKAAPNEYGFYANVNPDVDHPRWSQATERRIGELGRRATLPFNGYAEEVAGLYAGMDLAANY
jgi:sulfoxide reductase catalytic subunit YedY